jgi:hypothetical protein
MRSSPETVDSDVTRSTNGRTVVVIGAIVLEASANSWFPPGIAIRVGLIVLAAIVLVLGGKPRSRAPDCVGACHE